MSKIETTRLTPAIGAEIAGVDLSRPPCDAVCDALYALLMDHQVIFLRDQRMDPATQMALAEDFGEPEPPHPVYPHLEGYPSIMVLDFGGDVVPDTDVWHTDVTYRGSPPFASILRGHRIPAVGGDTLWLSMTAAHDGLPDGLRSDLTGLRCVHDLGDFRNSFTQGVPDGPATALAEAHARMGCAIHPLVRTHPVTGRDFLFCNPGFTIHVEGLTASDSRSLLNHLFDHIVRPEYQVRFRWTPGAVAIWDNRCTMHYPLGDYAPERRIMHRITVTRDRRLDGPEPGDR
ncbi:MAG: TauD/TfdA family dioxygenase [Paracoccaceae bacterium]|nr:TauD/TfdA family dioxygenase [Paracoccaceae bacterium]